MFAYSAVQPTHLLLECIIHLNVYHTLGKVKFCVSLELNRIVEDIAKKTWLLCGAVSSE